MGLVDTYLEDTYPPDPRQAWWGSRPAGGGLVFDDDGEQLGLAEQDAGERAPVDRTRAPAVERRQVLGGRVALVAAEAVFGNPRVGVAHQPVARDLRDDGR